MWWVLACRPEKRTEKEKRVVSIPVINANDKYDPIELLVIAKRGLLRAEDQLRLQSTLKWFELAVQVQRTTVTDEDIQQIRKNIQHYMPIFNSSGTGRVAVAAPNKAFSIDYDHYNLSNLWKRMIPIFLDYNQRECGNKNTLASATAIYSVTRPLAIAMNYCPENTNREHINSVFHAFRHEVLHGLQYGMLEKEGTPEEEKYTWVYENGKKDVVKRTFLKTNGDLDFKSIKDHFGCHDKRVIRPESDQRRAHLNEYIFGDELMTSLPQPHSVFSYISAEVLEKSYSGDTPWYKVNREFIAPEADTYTYGKGLGCDFLFKSCWELFKAKKSSIPFMYPFCRENLLDQDRKGCFAKPANSSLIHIVDCNKNLETIEGNDFFRSHPSSSSDGVRIVKQPDSNPINNIGCLRYCPKAITDYSKYQKVRCPS